MLSAIPEETLSDESLSFDNAIDEEEVSQLNDATEVGNSVRNLRRLKRRLFLKLAMSENVKETEQAQQEKAIITTVAKVHEANVVKSPAPPTKIIPLSRKADGSLTIALGSNLNTDFKVSRAQAA
jgi:hypothetical protein